MKNNALHELNGKVSLFKAIVSLSIAIGIGFTASTEAGIWNEFPVAVQSIFSQNVVSVIFVIALLMNLLLPKNLEE